MNTLTTIFSLIYQAMTVNFTVFGFTINLYSFFVFSVVMSVIAWFIRRFFGGDE